MENLLGIQPYTFRPVYSKKTEDSDLEGNSDSELVGNTNWRGCEVCVSLSEKECICCHEWDILEEKLEVKNLDSVTQHMDFTCLNPSVVPTSYLPFMRL